MKKLLWLSLIVILFFVNCAELTKILEQVNIKKPVAEISNISLENISLQDADLLVSVKVKNPNSVGIKLAGFDYDLILEGNSFLKGSDGSQLDIEANGEGIIKFPLKLNYRDIFKTYENLKEKDELGYTINLGLVTNLPVLGDVRIPISKSDILPTLKIPEIKLQAMKIEKLNLTTAEMMMKIEVINPNKWSLNLNKLNYNLLINNKSWAVGETINAIKMSGKKNSTIEIPFTLNYLEIGSSVYSMLKDNQQFDYKIKGNADISSSLKFLQNFDFPFEKAGSLNFTK